MRKHIKLMIPFVAMLISLFVFTACSSNVKTKDNGGNVTTNSSDEKEDESLQRMFSPVLSISKSGLVTWTDLDNASKYIYKIDDGPEVETTERKLQLELNQSVVVKACGDGVTKRSSRWSTKISYVPDHSYAIDNGGNITNTVNIYKPDGTIVLDTINNTKVNGDIINANEEYIVEFDITVGSYHNGLLLAGIDDAIISDLTWSDSQYNAREGENADTTDKFYEVLYNDSWRLYPDYPGLHRYDWSYTGEYWGKSTYGWVLDKTPCKNVDGVYDTTEENYFSVEPNYCSSLYGAHFIGTGKYSEKQMADGYRYVRFKIKYNSLRLLSTGQVDGVEEYGALLGRERFNLFAICHQNITMVYFNSANAKDYEARNYSVIKDDRDEYASDVRIYDALTKDIIIGTTEEPYKGKTLETGKKYIIEVDTTGTLYGSVLFTGLQDASISKVEWSNETFDNESGSSVISDTLRILENDSANHHLAKDNPMFHRIWATSDGLGYTGKFSRDCTAIDGIIHTKNNLSGESNCCMTFPRMSWFATKKTTKEADRKYLRIEIIYNNFTTVESGGPVTDKTSPNYGTLAGTYFNTFIYSPAGGRYLYLTDFSK